MKKTLTKLFLFTAITLSTACASEDTNSSYQIQLQNSQSPQLQNAKVKVKLYGTNIRSAGNIATLLSETITEIDAIPATISLEWPQQAQQLIAEPAVTNPEDAGYYLNISVDVNNDGRFCSGDLRQDFNKTPFKMMANKPKTPLQYELIAIANEICEPF